MASRQEAQQRAMVSKLSRAELEDQYLRTVDDMHILKAHGRKQEERIKKMATKLVKLANDRKKLMTDGGVKRSAREVDLEESVENQQQALRQLNKENETLKQKLRAAQQQILSQGKRQTSYSNVQSRIDSRKPKRPGDSPDRQFGSRSGRVSTRTSSPQQGRYGQSLLEEARNENHRLHQQVLVLQEQVARLEEERRDLVFKLEKLTASHEEELLNLRHHENVKEKTAIDGNIEMIKMQRQMKEKSNTVLSLEGRYEELQENFRRLRISYDSVMQEMDRLKSRLLHEENRNLSMQTSLKHDGSHQRTVAQLQGQIRELEKEVEILKDSNEKLMSSAFDQEKEKQWRQLERNLRVQIAQLEAAIKMDMGDKNNILDKMSSERGYMTRMHSESRKTYGELERIKRENEELRDRLRLYTSSDDSVDIDELREALSVIRQRKHAAAQKKRPDFLENVDDTPKDLETEFSELQTQHAETIQELDKTREMLLMQHKINKDYQIEVESVANQMEELKREYEAKLERFARLLDARAARIKKLESQLRDIAYGTKQFKFQPEKDEIETDETVDETIQLDRGENLFEICVSKAVLSKDALAYLDDREPSLFVTYAFYDYELVSTPVIKNSSPRYDFTAQFTVKVDDLFLHHLQREGTVFELHQAMGMDYKTVATCKVKFNQLLDKPQGKLFGSATLIGVNGRSFGTLDFWVRLRVPMDQAIRLYRERTKALGYLSANTAATRKTLELSDSTTDRAAPDNTNQLLLQLISCNHVLSRREGLQPNIYCVYKFFDFADHDTVVIPCTNNPHFDDRQAYPVQMTADLDAYLKSEKLIIYVFDDTDPDMASYLGKASIDLLPLAHNKVIKAPFQLLKSDNSENGTIEFAARWQLPYKSPEGVMKSDQSLTDEKEIQEARKLIEKPPITPKKKHSATTKPAAASSSKPVHLPPVQSQESVVSFSAAHKEPISPPVEMVATEAENDVEDEIELGEEPTMLDEPPEHDEEDVIEEPVEHEKKSLSGPHLIEHQVLVHREPTLVTEKKPTPVKRSLKLKDPSDLPKDAPSRSSGKKVSIVEPSEENPVPLSRSKPLVDDHTVEEESDLDELLLASETEETSPKSLLVSPEDEDTADAASESLSLESMLNLKKTSPPEDEDTLSDHGSFDSAELPTRDVEVVQQLEEPGEEERVSRTSKRDSRLPVVPEDEHEVESDSEEIQEEIEEIPDDTLDLPEDTKEKEDEESEEDLGRESSVGSKKETEKTTTSDTIRISINHLTLDPNTSVWGDNTIEKMFVEYEFLGTVEETPDVVMKPKNKDEKMIFKFGNSIKVDALEHSEQRNALSSMLTSGHTSFKMTVVSEPNNDEDEDCEEIGTASVDLAAILKNDRDMIDDDVTVEDLRTPGNVVGKLNITFEALDVLRMIKKELDMRLRESES